MIRSIFFALVLVAALIGAPTVAMAQESDENTTVSTENTPTTVGENDTSDLEGCDVRVDRHTRICESTFENGQSELVIHSNVTQSVTIADMGSFAQGGVVPRKDLTLHEGRNRITLRGVEYRGRAGVSIDTDRVLFAHQIETRFTLIHGPYSSSDVQTAGVAGALSVAVIVIVQSIRYMTGRKHDPERVA
jgi:hypothetical protein